MDLKKVMNFRNCLIFCQIWCEKSFRNKCRRPKKTL